jgi:hypothetical protein
MLIERNNEYFSKYFPLSDYGNLFFFSDNIIFSSNSSSDIHDYYFELLKFPELSSNNAYQTSQLLSCKHLNNDLGYILLESDAIEFDKFLYSAKNKCQDNKPIDCLKQFVDFADASNNNELSRAELTRFSRFVVKWLTLKGELQLNERMGAAAASMMIAPALAEFILLNYDYDNDDHIDIREMTYDIVNITGSSELNNKIIRGYIEAIDILSKSKKDATRFIMLSRSSDVELDFDFTKVKEKSKDNPLYYVQYCYARISSVFRLVGKNINNEIEISNYNFNYSSDEIKILRKISTWPKCIEVSSNKLEPHRIPVYLYELATNFHSNWNMRKVKEDKRFINKDRQNSDDK